MVAFLESMHVGANVQRSFGGAGGPWEFNLRDLLRWCYLAEGAVPQHMHNTPAGETQVCSMHFRPRQAHHEFAHLSEE